MGSQRENDDVCPQKGWQSNSNLQTNSITPTLQGSKTPLLRHSITPLLRGYLLALLPNSRRIEMTSLKFEILVMIWARCSVSVTSIDTSISAV